MVLNKAVTLSNPKIRRTTLNAIEKIGKQSGAKMQSCKQTRNPG
jgi:hypothetical protein